MHDIIVVSDLHMGRGKNPETQRFYSLETFFYDEDFARFCDFLCRDAAARGASFKLVFNGDVFDLLRIEPDPGVAIARERRFAMPLTPKIAAKTVSEILSGHPGFSRGVAQVLNAGYEVVFLPGNHDIEVQWEQVQGVIRQTLVNTLRTQYGDNAIAAAIARLSFNAWFYHEPKRVWVEHGCQYDPENSFRYLLRGSLAQAGDELHEAEQDLPLGNFFQRYLYNAFGHITFIVPSSRANIRYMKWLILHEPRLLIRVFFSHLPFTFQVLRRLSQDAREVRRVFQDAHETSLSEQASASGLGLRLLAIDQLKEVRADAVQAMRSLGWHLLKFIAGGIFFTVLTAGLWFLGFHTINELRWGFGGKTLLFLFLDLLIAGVTGAGVIYALIGGSAAVPPRPLRRAAQRIAAVLDVPIVTFGHSHDEELWRLERPSGGRAWYCNTGTWIAVFTHDVLLPRERIQYTFLRIRDMNVELLHWSPGRGEPMPVILLDESE